MGIQRWVVRSGWSDHRLRLLCGHGTACERDYGPVSSPCPNPLLPQHLPRGCSTGAASFPRQGWVQRPWGAVWSESLMAGTSKAAQAGSGRQDLARQGVMAVLLGWGEGSRAPFAAEWELQVFSLWWRSLVTHQSFRERLEVGYRAVGQARATSRCKEQRKG